MAINTLLFVHGTGVRNASYGVTLEEIRAKVNEFQLPCRVEPLLWGDVLGVDFAGDSLPQPCERTPEEEASALRWQYLQADPLFDLKLWCTPGIRKAVFGDYIGAETWEKISKYVASPELTTLLRLHGLDRLFAPAWKKVVESGLPEQAFENAGDETASVARVFAEAVTAQVMVDAVGVAVPTTLAMKIVERLVFDWDQMGKAFKDILLRVFGKATKQIIRPMRSAASKAVAPAIGDILHYLKAQNGSDLRRLIREKIANLAVPPDVPQEPDRKVFVLSHSLGGIACFETLVESRPANVAGLITAGSQAPLLYEFDALSTLRLGSGLPAGFVPWLNFYDENDLLSYRADPVFGCKADKQVDSMLPPLEAHSGYWKMDETWKTIEKFLNQHG